MSHFGIVCPPIPGHIHPACVLGRALVKRGHLVTVFHAGDLAGQIRAEGLNFYPLGQRHFAPGELRQAIVRMKELGGLAAVKFAVASGRRIAQMILDDAPAAFDAAGLDGLLVDQNEPAAATVAEHLKLPFVNLCTSLPLNRETHIPPPFVPWSFYESRFAALRNWLGYAVADRLVAPLQSLLNDYRSRWGLSQLHSPNDSFSRLGELAQMPRGFDFPHRYLPPTFHYTGPWLDGHAGDGDFPFDRLDGKPLIYGSLGTLQNSNSRYFQMMAEACSGLDVQLVVSVGGLPGSAVLQLPGKNVLAVNFAPQAKLLRRAVLTITHAGMNTTLQALCFGCPVIAIPLTHDQPAIAARLARTGAGVVIPPRRMSVANLRSQILQLLESGNLWRARARALAQEIEVSGGVETAADVCERVLPVTERVKAAAV